MLSVMLSSEVIDRIGLPGAFNIQIHSCMGLYEVVCICNEVIASKNQVSRVTPTAEVYVTQSYA